MRLLIKQRVFSWADKYDVYDERGNVRYRVSGELISLGHKLHVCDDRGNELGMVKEKLLRILPEFDIEIGGRNVGKVERRFTMFRPKYDVDFKGWRVEGDFLGWDYEVWQACSIAARISKQLFHWGDTYVIDYADPADELAVLMLVIAIDAANCARGAND